MPAIPLPTVLAPWNVESGTATWPGGGELDFGDGQFAEYRVSSAAELEYVLSALASTLNGAVVTVKLDDQVVDVFTLAPADTGDALDADFDATLG